MLLVHSILVTVLFIHSSVETNVKTVLNETRNVKKELDLVYEFQEAAPEQKKRIPRAYTRWEGGLQSTPQTNQLTPPPEIISEAASSKEMLKRKLKKLSDAAVSEVTLKRVHKNSTIFISKATTDTKHLTDSLPDETEDDNIGDQTGEPTTYSYKKEGPSTVESSDPVAKFENDIEISEYVVPCSFERVPELSMHEHHSLTEINRQLSSWATSVGGVRVRQLGKTIHGRAIRVLDIDRRAASSVLRKNVLIVAGINGRDQHAVSAALHIAQSLLVGGSGTHEELLTRYRFLIVPVLNPDGYHLALTSSKHRDWVKNVHGDANLAVDSTGTNCQQGVNIDRNFEYQWIKTLPESAGDQCGPLYGGSSPLNQPESKAMASFRPKPDYFITLKEDDIMGVLYPHAYTRAQRFGDENYRRKSLLAARAASSHGVHYKHGQFSEFFPLYAGGLEDWIEAHIGTENVYTVIVNTVKNKTADIEKISKAALSAVESLLLENFPSMLSGGGLASTAQWEVLRLNIIFFFMFLL